MLATLPIFDFYSHFVFGKVDIIFQTLVHCKECRSECIKPVKIVKENWFFFVIE